MSSFGSIFFVLFFLSLRFGQISPLAFFRWFLPRPRIGMLSLVTVSPVITALHSCTLSHHVFDQVNLWPAWVGFETAIFWEWSPGTVETQRLYPLRNGPRRAIKDGFFGLINPFLVFHSRFRTEFLYLSLIGIILRWGFLIWELIFIYCRLFVLILVWFFFFCVVSSFTTFRLNFTSSLLQVIFTATSDRNAVSCNRIPSNYCLP